MYIYFCEKCRDFKLHEGYADRHICEQCGTKELPICVRVDDWNRFSNDEMREAMSIAKMRNSNRSNFDNRSAVGNRISYKRRGKNTIGAIIGGVIVTIIILSLVGVIVYRNSTKKKVDTDKDSIQEVSNEQNVNEESSKEDLSSSKDENKSYTKYPDDKDGDINVNNDYFELTCEKMSVTVDTSGNPAIVVTFKFVNRSDEPLSFIDAFDVKMSQKGSVCSSNVSFSEKPDNIDNKTKKINKGDSIECAFGFELHDLFADVELTVFDKYLGFDEIGTTVVPIS